MSENHFRRDKEFAVLSKRLDDAKARHKSRPEKVTAICLEIAEYLRNTLNEPEEAARKYTMAISWGSDHESCALDCSLAYRNLAEIAVENDEYDSAIDKICKSLDYAYQTGNPGLIQQALHQRAHICNICELPEKALTYAEECRSYLDEHSDEIDDLKRDGDSRCRLAHLHSLMAGIYNSLHASDIFQQYGYDKKGLEINEKAIKYASENENWVLLYRALLMKLDLTLGKERLQIAQTLCSIASKVVPTNAEERRFKKESKCHLALEKLRYFEQGDLAKSKSLLWKCYEEFKKEPGCVTDDVQESVRNALVFVYKTENRIDKAHTMNVKDNAKRRHAQMCVFEKIGDDASALNLNEIALQFYQRMQKCADSANDQRKAWHSMAEAAKDCKLWGRALAFFKEVMKREQELDYSEKQLLETDIAIAIVSAECDAIPVVDRLNAFREVYARCNSSGQKQNILPDYVKFMKLHPSSCRSGELEEKLHQKKLLEGQKSSDLESNCSEEENDRTPPDEFDEMNEHQILFNLQKEMRLVEREERIAKDKTNKNKHGESSLHEVARSGEYQQLKELIDKGYNVNQLDHGGWSPLSEAVSAQDLTKTRLLLMKGANPNTQSTEFLVDEDQNKITSSGLTPLMEACSVANIDIARILLQFKARASTKDDDDWTALEYLREFILNARGVDETRSEKLRKLAELIEQRQAEEGFAPRNYDYFLELLGVKHTASQRANHQKRSGSPQNQSSEAAPSSRKRNYSGTPSPERVQSHSKRPSSEKRSAWIDDNSDSDGSDENEETRNLDDYRRCIERLKKGKGKRAVVADPEFSNRTPLVMQRHNRAADGSRSAKKLFFR